MKYPDLTPQEQRYLRILQTKQILQLQAFKLAVYRMVVELTAAHPELAGQMAKLPDFEDEYLEKSLIDLENTNPALAAELAQDIPGEDEGPHEP